MKTPVRPILAFSHASQFIRDLNQNGLLSATGEVLCYKADDPSLMAKRVSETDDVNWKARGFADRLDFTRRMVLQQAQA